MRALREKIKAPQDLGRQLARERKRGAKRGLKVVFTNGCFDLLHKGHVTYLEKARQKGDLLIVGVNSDASVRRAKGRERPLNGLADRLEVLAALESVDYVTWFEKDTPLELILKLRPDVLVKGADWKASEIAGGKEVKSWGGKLVRIKVVPDRSTTRLIGLLAKTKA